jgi:hypothetical protein
MSEANGGEGLGVGGVDLMRRSGPPPRRFAPTLPTARKRSRGEGNKRREPAEHRSVDAAHRAHIRKMPKRVGSGGGAFVPAASASPSTVRVSAGSMMPSSQRRAVA